MNNVVLSDNGYKFESYLYIVDTLSVFVKYTSLLSIDGEFAFTFENDLSKTILFGNFAHFKILAIKLIAL